MSKETTSQSHNASAPDPMAPKAVMAAMASFARLGQDQWEQFSQQMADLTKKSLDYVTQLTSAWQGLAIDVVRRQGDAMQGAADRGQTKS